MNSPDRKAKETSLSEFYKKLQYHEQNYSNLSLTPTKRKSSKQHDPNKYAGKISSPGTSKISHSSFQAQKYAELDLNSNLKMKANDIFQIKQNQDNNNDQIKYKPSNLNQDLFKKVQNTKLNSNLFDHEHQQLMSKKFQHQQSDFDYNLSVEPEQIKIPSINKYSNKITQFKLNQDDKLESNFFITPEPSLIKSPERVKQQQIKNFTPEVYQKQEKQTPTSQIIQRMGINNYQIQNTYQRSLLSPKKNSHINQGQHQASSVSPSSLKYKNSNQKANKISPNKSPKQLSSPYQGSQDQDEQFSQLLSKTNQLYSQVNELKTHKFLFAINKYRQQVKYELQKHLKKSIEQINSKYDKKQSELKKQAEGGVGIVIKSIEDIGKYKRTYGAILSQLKQNKQKIEEQYKQKVEQVKKYKDRIIHEWKRQSNEEIKKIVNNTHSKHSAKLAFPKEKSVISSKQKLSK